MSVDVIARRQSPWRIVAIVAAVVVVLVAIFGFTIWRMTSGPADAASAFLKTTATAGPDEAWQTASPAFQQTTPPATWSGFARQTGLTGYTSASWRSRAIINNTAHLEGSATIAGGGTVPLSVDLVRGGSGGWQVQLIRTSGSGVRLDTSAAPPSQSTTSTIQPGNVAIQPPAPSASAWNGGATPALDAAALPGAKVAGICMTKLQEQAGVKFDSIECLAGLPARIGATTQCSIAKGLQHGQMVVTVTAFDAATGKVDFNCTPGNPS